MRIHGFPIDPVLGALPERRHRGAIRCDGEGGSHLNGRVTGLCCRRNVTAPGEMQDAVVVDAQLHHFVYDEGLRKGQALLTVGCTALIFSRSAR